MRVCDKCLHKLDGNKLFHISIESFGALGSRINSECRYYEVCEDCVSKVETILQPTNNQEADK